MPDRPHAAAARRGRRRSAPEINPSTRRREILDIIAAGLARIAAAPPPDMPPQESGGDGLELPEHAALSVVARGPTGEHPAPHWRTRTRPESSMAHDVKRQTAALERMTVGQLRRAYAKVFGRPIRTNRKQCVWKLLF